MVKTIVCQPVAPFGTGLTWSRVWVWPLVSVARQSTWCVPGAQYCYLAANVVNSMPVSHLVAEA